MRIARHYRGRAQSEATLQGPTAPKRYRIFSPRKSKNRNRTKHLQPTLTPKQPMSAPSDL